MPTKRFSNDITAQNLITNPQYRTMSLDELSNLINEMPWEEFLLLGGKWSEDKAENLMSSWKTPKSE